MYFKKRGYKTQGDVLDDPKAYQQVLDTIHYLKCGKHRNFKAFVCNVSAKYDAETKTCKYRDAWVYDMSLLAVEKTFTESITYDSRRKVPSPLMHNILCAPHVMSLDITKFDAHVSADTIRCAFAYLFSKFDITKYRPDENKSGYERVYSVDSMKRLMNVIVHNFIHTKYRTAGGRIGQKHYGIPSGSAFTNLIATLCANMIAHSVVKDLGLDAYVHTHGDDTFIVFRSGIDADSKELVNGVVQGYANRGMQAKVAKRLEHGCHIMCKTWCLQGTPFHPGNVFVNILNTLKDLRYWNMVLKMLITYYDATDVQRIMLSQLFDLPVPQKRIDTEAPMWVLRLVSRGEIAM